MTRFFVGLLIALTASAASASLTCPRVEVALRGVEDDRCAALAEAAEGCFDRLNRKLLAFKAKPLAEGYATIKGEFEAGLAALDGYFPHLKKLDCGDQEEEVRVFVDEIETDEAELRTLAGKTK